MFPTQPDPLEHIEELHTQYMQIEPDSVDIWFKWNRSRIIDLASFWVTKHGTQGALSRSTRIKLAEFFIAIDPAFLEGKPRSRTSEMVEWFHSVLNLDHKFTVIESVRFLEEMRQRVEEEACSENTSTTFVDGAWEVYMSSLHDLLNHLARLHDQALNMSEEVFTEQYDWVKSEYRGLCKLRAERKQRGK